MKPPDLFDFTQGNLQDYVDCPYRFHLRHALRTRWPALVVEDALDHERQVQSGARFHRLIQQFLLGVPEARLSALAAADPNPDISRWWEDFLTVIPPLLTDQRHVETTLSAHLAGRRLVAKYDLIQRGTDGGWIIFDWKTSAKRIRKDWLLERVQTRLYRFLLARAGGALAQQDILHPDQVTMVYWFAPHPNDPVSLPYSQGEFDQDKAYFTQLVAEIQAREPEDFRRTDDLRHCRFCTYRAHCDRGATAGSIDEFEPLTLEAEERMTDLDFDQIEPIAFF